MWKAVIEQITALRPVLETLASIVMSVGGVIFGCMCALAKALV